MGFPPEAANVWSHGGLKRTSSLGLRLLSEVEDILVVFQLADGFHQLLHLST